MDWQCKYFHKKRHAMQRGNVLFLILIAVALFAALSYIVMSSTRVRSESLSKERSELYTSEIMNYTAAISSRINRLIVSEGCAPQQLDPYADGWFTFNGAALNSANVNAPPDGRCQIFGGKDGVPIKTFPEEAFSLGGLTPSATTPVAPYGVTIRGANIVGMGSPANDIILSYSPLKRDFCLHLLKKFNMGSDDIPLETTFGLPLLDNIATAMPAPLGDENPLLGGAGRYNIVLNTTARGTAFCVLYSVVYVQ